VKIRHDRWRRGALTLLFAFGLGAPAQGLQIDDGDLVGVFVKNGFEVIVNMGPATAGSTLDLAGVVDVAEFGGSLAGAKFVGLGVEDPLRTVTCCGGTFPLENVIYTSLVPDPMPSDLEIENAMKALDVGLAGSTVWFSLLRQLPGTDSELVASAQLYSYETVVGVGTDAIANMFTFSTAGVFDDQGRLSIPVYSAVRGYGDFGGPDVEYLNLAQLSIDGTDVSFEPAPEAPAVLGMLGAAAALLAASRQRRRRLG